ncbi:DNA processing protein [Scopulibacillus darangshiensis]|uniref:DNA processing protein n=1 Tax=Scopulibacillus darangshiensis TaxID=442528 RepID=A0A4R2P3C5_9BACL|nr:DNA-processing protein DprA [Scopulibacillus darangshiensis]TCP29172.1 DNA processing protein [Scopulibacillus darangshiensis]
MEKRDKLIRIHHCRGAGWKTVKKLLDLDPELKHIDDMSANDLCHYLKMKREHANRFYYDLHSFALEKYIHSYNKNNIFVMTIDDAAYPSQLRNIYDPPWVLFGKGDKSLLNSSKLISVVGTRQPTQTARLSMEKLLLPLIEDGWTIVSGMALGIDGYAHHIALKFQTIAVLASGLYHPYPRKHHDLFQRMIANHLVISEYPPNIPPQKWQFPERNRIISGLSQGTIVVEAKERSGSLITADQALDQGREVFAVPGMILEPNAAGTNRLIQQGAKLVIDANDILNELNRNALI